MLSYDIIKEKKRGKGNMSSRKQLQEELRTKYIEIFTEIFENREEEVLRVASNKIAFPVLDSEGGEEFIEITVKVPTGSNKGADPYDGYALAEEYRMKLAQKEEKKKENEEKKKKKIERDKKYREKKKEIMEQNK